jgi:hypothetical protein
LAEELRALLPEVHVIGDAFAPRRHLYATREAFALVQQINGPLKA